MRSISEIREIAANVGSNSVSVFGGNFEGGYQLQQDIDEVSQFLWGIQQIPVKNYLEIGVAAAGMTRLLCDIVSVENVYLMDLGEHPSIPAAYDNNIKNLKNTGTVKSFRGDSHSAEAEKWLSDQNVKFDMAFIDGDHSYKGVLADTILAKKFAKAGCVFIYHDHACVGDIGRLVEELDKGRHGRFACGGLYQSKAPTKKGIAVFRLLET